MAREGWIGVAVATAVAVALSGTESTGPTLRAEAVATSVRVLPLEIVTSVIRDALTR
jgi:hypothetical protein